MLYVLALHDLGLSQISQCPLVQLKFNHFNQYIYGTPSFDFRNVEQSGIKDYRYCLDDEGNTLDIPQTTQLYYLVVTSVFDWASPCLDLLTDCFNRNSCSSLQNEQQNNNEIISVGEGRSRIAKHNEKKRGACSRLEAQWSHYLTWIQSEICCTLITFLTVCDAGRNNAPYGRLADLRPPDICRNILIGVEGWCDGEEQSLKWDVDLILNRRKLLMI